MAPSNRWLQVRDGSKYPHIILMMTPNPIPILIPTLILTLTLTLAFTPNLNQVVQILSRNHTYIDTHTHAYLTCMQVVQILSRNLDDDAEHMPDGPGPVMSMQGDGGDEGDGDGWCSENDFDEGLSVHSEQNDAIDY